MRTGRGPLNVLGLQPDATRDDIVRAYRRLALLTHPDVSRDPQAAQRFASLTDAYRRALAEAGSRRATPTASPPAPHPQRTAGHLHFVAGPVHVLPQPLRPTRKDA